MQVVAGGSWCYMSHIHYVQCWQQDWASISQEWVPVVFTEVSSAHRTLPKLLQHTHHCHTRVPATHVSLPHTCPCHTHFTDTVTTTSAGTSPAPRAAPHQAHPASRLTLGVPQADSLCCGLMLQACILIKTT